MRTHIIRLIQQLASATNRSPHTISYRVSGSGDLYARLIRGCDVTTGRGDRIVQRLSDHWPSGTPWPADIVRPEPSSGSPAAKEVA